MIIRKKSFKLTAVFLMTIVLGRWFYGEISPFFSEGVTPALARGRIIVVLDAGHGGRDPGAVAKGIYEKNINLDVAKRLAKMLKARGYHVVLTRSGDSNLVNWKDGGSYQRASLWQRARISKDKNASVLISIHCNSDRNKQYYGSQTFYHSQSTRGKNLARAIQSEMKKVRYTRREAIPGDYYLLKNTACPTVIVELGYLSNSRELNVLCSPQFRQKYAQAIADGFSKVY
ncbi:MAG: N-acetylmuramoyl-L-alanine amidase family protein [Peptococcaceae bacterium]